MKSCLSFGTALLILLMGSDMNQAESAPALPGAEQLKEVCPTLAGRVIPALSIGLPSGDASVASATMVAANADYRVLWGDLQALRSEGRLEPRLPNSRGAVPFVGVGGALADTEILIADPAGRPLPDRRVGRILVRGSGVTASARGGAAMLDTGDLGFRCDGELFFAGRAKDIIIRSGANISPTDLEAAAEEVAGVRRGAVAAFSCVRPERGRDEIVVAVEARRDAMNRREALAAEVQLHVSRRAAVQVDEVVVVAPASLPKTTSGKIQRSLCRDLYLADELRKRVGPGRLLRLIGRIKAGLSR